MYDLYTQFLRASPSLKFMFLIFMGMKIYLTLSYVKEKIIVYLCVTLLTKILSVYLHPRAPEMCIKTQTSSKI